MLRKIILLLCVGAIFAANGCTARVRTSPPMDRARVEFTRDFELLDFSTVQYTPWDVESAVKTAGVHAPKAYTIMIYLNGSDLETDGGEATKDILEMLSSGVDTALFNVIIFTGGTHRWRTQEIPADDCVIWRLERDGLERIANVGLRSMGDAGTLSGFIRFTLQAFPATQFGLIFWDHGGGSIAGFGHDEIFNDSHLTLLEMDYAMHKAGLSRDHLEFIGFDACLMATVEMAVVSSRYARYFIASQDLEPGDGWDYNFLGVLNDNPCMDGAELGRAIADSYMAFYGSGTTENLTMSVTDLAQVKTVMAAMGNLMDRCAD
ncbi:MAG: clostripain-related cysteine peptidase, partial [Oscillospiraceae bacterium]|nr:clostripain-related cysteine peptidase [Oscillospiraceae bacterium]